ncbi:MAG: DUF4157 domain-containing protein [Cytophagales bacterium]|nr:MAG: DUF4157 domain-containing protein [Cytophagales bacterium]TAF62381.1 MAG: DUF4157 domain-containing protein [Cytophagales bacterium]
MANSFASQTTQRKENLKEETFQGNFEPIQKTGNNTGLPDNLKSGIENLSGYSMDDVKVHYNSDKPAQLQALAYAQGTDIYLGSGQEKHLSHEAWHVVQQKQGRVKPTMQMKDKVNVNNDSGLEKEADVMGAKALQMKIPSNVAAHIAIQSTSNKKKDFGLVDNLLEAVTQHKSHKTAEVSSSGIIQLVSIEEDIQALKDVKQISNDPLLSKILKEVIDTIEKKTTSAVHGESSQKSHMGPEGKHGENRSHKIVIDPTNYPDDVERQSVLVHETIHASADTKYGFNKKFDTDAFNIVHSDKDKTTDLEAYNAQVPVLIEILYSLKSKIEKDRKKLGETLADHIVGRIDRAIGAPNQEFDTVISELYYYLRVKHTEIDTGGAFHELKKTAGAAYDARNKGKSVRDSFDSELPRLNIQKHRREYQEKISGFNYLPKNNTLVSKFKSTKQEAIKALDEASEKDLKSTYEQYLMKLMQVQLKSYGKQAETIAEANDLSKRELTYLDWRMEIRDIKGWKFEAEQKLAKKWFFKGTLRDASTRLGEIIASFNPLINRHYELENFTPEDL